MWGFLGVETIIQGYEEAVLSEINFHLDEDWQQEAAKEIAGITESKARILLGHIRVVRCPDF